MLQITFLLAIVANQLHVQFERRSGKLPPSLSGGSSWHSARQGSGEKSGDSPMTAFETSQRQLNTNTPTPTTSNTQNRDSGVIREVAMTRNPVYPHRGTSFSSVVSATATGKTKVTEIGNWA